MACVAGVCGKREVIQPGAVGGPRGIAANGSDVYWSDGQKICQTTIDSKVVVYFEPVLMESPAVHGDRLYWLQNEGLFAEALAHGPIESFGVNAKIFALNETRIFWVDEIGRLFTAPAEGGETERIASGLGSPSAMIADDTHLYWMDKTGALLSVATTGGEPSVLVPSASPNGGHIALDAEFIYWASDAFRVATGESGTWPTSRIMRVPKGGGTPAIFADGEVDHQRFANVVVDGESVYWTTSMHAIGRGEGSSSLVRAPRAGGPAIRLVSAPAAEGVTDFALDPNGVSYLGMASGSLHGVFRVSPR